VTDAMCGTEPGSGSATYTYVDAPTLISITPGNGLAAGGQTVTLSGDGFLAEETEVFFGSGAAFSLTVNSSTSATVITPPGAHGRIDVTVRTPGGEATLPDGFAYFAPPVITSFSPASGSPGAQITIVGDFFDSDASGNEVRFGSLAASVTSATQTALSVTVPAGATTGRIRVTTAGGVAESATDFVVSSSTLTSISLVPPFFSLVTGETRQLAAFGNYSDGSSRDITNLATWSAFNTAVAVVDAPGLARGVGDGQTAIRASLDGVLGASIVQVASIPPDPSSVATTIDTTVASDMSRSVQFLWTGPNPIQKLVTASAMDSRRIAVIRGRVRAANEVPIAGVRVSVLGRSQFGFTLTRSDGMFD
jgi:hypothetical protein